MENLNDPNLGGRNKSILNDFIDKVESISTNKLVRIYIPLFLIIFGAYMLYLQFQQNIAYELNKIINSDTNTIVSPLGDDYFDRWKDQISSPEFGYFSKVLAENITQTQELDSESENYSGTFYLSIPSINIKNAPTKGNVPSTSETEYNSILNKYLGHFKGTPIPGKVGNSFIYGHSINEAHFKEDPNNPYVEFTKLFRLKIGEKIYIERDGTTYSYTIFKIKEVEPDRVDVLQLDNKSEKLITLMTCGAPPGDSSRRFIVVARQDE
jgi:LPXTG-site transpeptidase (sortase) family protein